MANKADILYWFGWRRIVHFETYVKNGISILAGADFWTDSIQATRNFKKLVKYKNKTYGTL